MAVDYATLKKGGFMRQKQKNNLSPLLKLLKQRRLPTWNHYKNM